MKTMSVKGDWKRPTGKGLYNKESSLPDLYQAIFWEKDPAKKEALKKQLKEFKDSLNDKKQD